MASERISQREAHRLRKQARAQAKRIENFEWSVRMEGVEIFKSEDANGSLAWAVQTAQRLGHLVVARQYGNTITYRAMPLPSEDVKP